MIHPVQAAATNPGVYLRVGADVLQSEHGVACREYHLLKLGHQVRFTETERRKHDNVGIDLTDVRTIDQYSRAIEVWALCMAEAYPDVLKRFVRQLEQKVAAQSSASSPTGTTDNIPREEA